MLRQNLLIVSSYSKAEPCPWQDSIRFWNTTGYVEPEVSV